MNESSSMIAEIEEYLLVEPCNKDFADMIKEKIRDKTPGKAMVDGFKGLHDKIASLENDLTQINLEYQNNSNQLNNEIRQ